MANLDFLKPILGDEDYTRFLEKMSEAKGINLINAADGSYVPKAKFDTELAAKKQYLTEMENLGKAKASLDAEIASLRDQLSKAGEDGARREKEAAEHAKTVTKLQEQIKQLAGDLDQRKKDLEAAIGYKGEVDRLTAEVASRDKAIATIHKQHRLSGLLREAGARNPDVLMRMIDLDRVTEADGKVSGLEEQLKALKTSDPYLFQDRPAPRGGVDAGSHHPAGTAEDAINRQVNLEIRRAAGFNV